MYYHHKDLWVDEAALVFSVYGIPLKDIFFQPLPNLQAAPLLFLLFSRGFCAIFGYSEYALYFLPLVCGIGTLVLSVILGRKLLGGFGAFILLLLCVGSPSLAYYSAEFKQYGIEAFCSFLLLYIYQTNDFARQKWQDKKFLARFYIICMICLLFANTSIFISIALGIGILYQNRNNLKEFFRANAVWILSVLVFFALYYMLYVKFQRVDGFYKYWESYFLPRELSAYPAFIKGTLFGLLTGFMPLAQKYAWIYIVIWLAGICVMFNWKRDMFIICVSAMVIYILLSLFKIYPFGHGGMIGARLSLYMSPIFYVPCCYLFAFFVKQRLKILAYIVVAALCYKTLLNHRHSYPNGHYIQQTHALITQANKSYTNSDLILVYHATKNVYNYYSFLDSVSNPYETFSDDLNELGRTIEATNARKIYILGSHYPGDDWLKKLEILSLKFDKNATFKYGVGGWGSFLIELKK